MSSNQPATLTQPRLSLSLLLLVASIAVAFAFASAFEQAPANSDASALCGESGTPITEQANPHDAHQDTKPGPAYFAGGLWSPRHGIAPILDTALLAIDQDGRSFVCQSAISVGDRLVIIDRTPIHPSAIASTGKPDLLLSIDYAGGISSMEYPAAGELQKYITAQKPNYNRILIIEPIPGPDRDPDEDWTYLNFDGDDKIDFFTPKRKASPQQIAMALIELLGGKKKQPSDLPTLFQQLGSENTKQAANARLELSQQSPYQVIPALDAWLSDADSQIRDQRVYDALMIRRAMGVHADALIAEAAKSDNAQRRALAARAIADLAAETTDPFGRLTPLAEDDDPAVRYEALVAARAMPGRRAAGIAQLVEPYEMTDAMRAVYQGTMAELLAFGEPIQADSKANRLRRMAISDLLKEDRGVLVCTILLERTDLPDDKIDEILGQLAEATKAEPSAALLNLIVTSNPQAMLKREALLRTLVDWPLDQLVTQREKLAKLTADELLPDALRAPIAGAYLSTLVQAGVIQGTDRLSATGYSGLAWIKNPTVLKALAPLTINNALGISSKHEPTSHIAALDALQYLPDGLISDNQANQIVSLARESDSVDLRFAAIRAINALPTSLISDGIDDLKLTTINITAIAGMKYDKEKLTVTAGRPVELTLINPDTMEHNLVVTLPGRAQEIGIDMSADPTAAAAVGYVPKDNDAVLHYTKMITPGTSDTIRFFAPTKPDNYEYVCTFPGHYTSMRGILEVVAP